MSEGWGAPTRSNFTLVLFSNLSNSPYYFKAYKVIHTPLRPALAVRPDLWIYASISLGGSHCNTKSTSGMSRPLATTSVAINILNLPSLKP
jgi:hypothetical protein